MGERVRADHGAASRQRRAPAPVVGRLLEPLYAAAVRRRNAGFDSGRKSARFVTGDGSAIPVISIGNLSVGGTGKTPLVMHTVRVLLTHGRRPCIAMRGYSKSKDGAADETDAYQRAFAGVPIVAQADRTAGIRELLAGQGEMQQKAPGSESRGTQKERGSENRGTHIDCIVLDDGFQHRQIARDLDVVLIDATPGRWVFSDRLLPAGWLREPVESLRRASVVVLTHAELATGEQVEGLTREVGKYARVPVAVTRHVWTGLKQRADGEDRLLPLETLVNKRIVGCCAIGHPEAFVAALNIAARRAGSDDVRTIVFPDHDPLGEQRQAVLRGTANKHKADYIVVTDKDWSKLRHLPESTWTCPVVRPELAMVFDAGGEEFDAAVVRAGGGT